MLFLHLPQHAEQSFLLLPSSFVLLVLVLSSAPQETLYTSHAQNEFCVSCHWLLQCCWQTSHYSTSHSILDESDSSDCVFTKTLLLSAVTVFLLAKKLRSASAFPCVNAKQAFTTLVKVQYFR